jgi:hypothetical protein
MPQLRQHEVNGHRQLRRGENLLADAVEDFLCGHVLAHPLAEHLEQVHLLDVLFAG